MRLSSFRVGEGQRPTVLLHGFLGQGKNLRTLAVKWAERDPSRWFLLPDLRGHGTSPHADESTDLQAMAEDVIETARAEGITGAFDWVGHSQGGRVSLAAARAFPEAVSSVALLDIAPGPIETKTSESGKVLETLVLAPDAVPDKRDLRAFFTGRGLSPALADWLLMNVVEENGVYRWRIDRNALWQLHARVNAEDLWDAVERSGIPMQCIRGTRSPYVTDEDARRLERAGCPVHSVATGHYVHVEALEPLLDLLAP